MHTSLHGRYVEHRLGNELPDQLISIKGKINDISLSEETWAKKNQMEASYSSKSRSKYYAAPTSMPTPRKTKQRGRRIGPVPGPGENSDKELSGNAEDPSEEASEDGDGSYEATSSTKVRGMFLKYTFLNHLNFIIYFDAFLHIVISTHEVICFVDAMGVICD